jgi:hypothetical protein
MAYGPPPGYGPLQQYPQQPQGYGYPPQGPPPPRPKSVFSGVLLALIVFFVVLPIGGVVTCVVCAGVMREHAKDTAIGTARPHATLGGPTPTATPLQPDPPGSFRDGSLVVGTDVAPGTYRTREAGRGCYWARLAGFSGELGDTLANGNETGPMIITIGKSDKGFESKRCGLWVTDLSAITEGPSEPFGDGTYIVGTDIAPGTWRNDAPQGCYWSRLRGFSGQMGDLITNANGKGIVTIATTDKGFKSHRCGTWTKS